jgi:hypothetical protein
VPSVNVLCLLVKLGVDEVMDDIHFVSIVFSVLIMIF